MAATVREDALCDPEITEDLAMVCGIQLCLNLGIHNLIIESDYQLLVKEIQSREASLSFGGDITQDIKNLMTRF